MPPVVPSGHAADNSLFTLLTLGRIRNKQREKVQKRSDLDHWEDEGGSLAASDIAALRLPLPDRASL
jgi:hypothetical protein